MRAMLSQSGLPMSFWSEACLYGNHLRNRLPHGPRGSTTAYEKKHLKKPDLSKERTFGLVVRTDNAQEYLVLKDEFRLHSITLKTTSIYTHYQIGIAERFNRTIDNIMRAMLSQSGLLISFQSKAYLYRNHLKNRLPHNVKENTSIYEKKYLKKPDLSKERTFGCVYLIYISKDLRESKLYPRGYETIYLKYLLST